MLVSSDAQPYIYNANQDSENKPPEWHLELEGAQDAPDVVINDSMEFQQKHHRCVFFHEGDFWALAFPDVQSFSAFSQKYNKTLFENMYRVEKTEDNELQVSPCFYIGLRCLSWHHLLGTRTLPSNLARTSVQALLFLSMLT